ncbi:MAG: hypothetical protein M3345_03820 [Actinomycetota bacterium]|nr:hypothetical protein [Actinomycetota bacterium]
MLPAKTKRAWITTALLLVLAGAPTALGQETGRIKGVEISPALFEYDLPGRDFRVKMVITNREPEPRRIHLSVSGLGHDLDGTPLFLEPAEATNHITLSLQGRFVLAPGEKRDFLVEGAIPPDQRSLYATIIAEFEPLEKKVGRQIETRSRVATLFLVRGPRPWVQELEVVDVGILPGPKRGPFTVYAAGKNVGDVHFTPRGKIEVFQDGRLLDVVPLQAERVIPGFARRLTGTWDPGRKLDGAVELRARFGFPVARGSAEVDFTKGSVQQPGMDIVDFVAREGRPRVELVLKNTGSLAIAPAVELTASENGSERARTVLVPDAIAPGELATVEWDPELADGVYLMRAHVTYEGTLLAEGAVGLQLGGGSESPLRLVALGLLFLALLGLMLLLVSWRRRRRDDHGGRSAARRPAGNEAPA